MKTYHQFIKALFSSAWNGKPSQYIFKNSNRANLDFQLGQVQGKGKLDQNLLNHYTYINVYCDQNNVTLEDNELDFFKEKFKPGSKHTVSQLLADETRMFNANATSFSPETLDYILRAERPDFELVSIPGTLEIKK